MYVIRKHSSTSNILRGTIRNSSTGQGLTGLTYSSSGLVIGTICDNESSATYYTAANSSIEAITTCGSFVAPSSAKCRFGEVSSSYHPGLYEVQLADARFSVANAKILRVTLAGATNMLSKDIVVQLENAPADVVAISGTNVSTGQAQIGANVVNWNATSVATPTVAGVPIVQLRNSSGTAGINAPTNFEDLSITDTSGMVTASNAMGAPTAFAPTAMTVTYGTLGGGGSYTKLESHDEDYNTVTESGTDGIDVTVTCGTSGTSLTPTLCRISGYYSGASSGHNVGIYAYNYTLNVFELKGTMKHRTSSFDYVIPMGSDNHNASTGEMKLNFLHSTATYNPSHTLVLDWVSFEKIDSASQLNSDVAAIYTLLQDVDTEVDEIAGNVDGKISDVITEVTSAKSEIVTLPDGSLLGKRLLQAALDYNRMWVDGWVISSATPRTRTGDSIPTSAEVRFYAYTQANVPFLLIHKPAGSDTWLIDPNEETPCPSYCRLYISVQTDSDAGFPETIVDVILTSAATGNTVLRHPLVIPYVPASTLSYRWVGENGIPIPHSTMTGEFYNETPMARGILNRMSSEHVDSGTIGEAIYNASAYAVSANTSVQDMHPHAVSASALALTINASVQGLVEDSGGTTIFTTSALSQAPTGGGGGDASWDTALPGAYAEGTAGYLLGSVLTSVYSAATNASTYGSDTWTAVSAMSGVVDSISVSAGSIVSEVAAVSSNVEAVSANVAAVSSNVSVVNDGVVSAIAAISAIPTDVAGEVFNATVSNYTTDGSFGNVVGTFNSKLRNIILGVIRR